MRYKKAFELSKQNNKIAFIPFVTLGDVDYESSFEIIKTFLSCKVEALELGFAFSDPVADGETIQKAAKRALSAGANTQKNFDLLKKIRDYDKNIPIGLLLYANLVSSYGLEDFYKKSKEVGVDSILIADVPLSEIEVFENLAQKYEISQVLVASSFQKPEALKQIAQKSKAYIYTLAQEGVTGVPVDGKIQNKDLVRQLQNFSDNPICLGFGISTPNDVNAAKKLDINGVICGSAIVKIIEKNQDNLPKMLKELKFFIGSMQEACKYDSP